MGYSGIDYSGIGQSFSDVRVRGLQVRVRKFRTLKTLRTQRVCLFAHLLADLHRRFPLTMLSKKIRTILSEFDTN
jgi:hypothetical protein